MTFIGQEVRRKEDDRLVTGRGQYADDLRFDGCAYLALARSPHAHARIAAIDVEAARAAPGVLAVFTGADLAAAGIGPIPHAVGSSRVGADVGLANADGSERSQTPHHPLPLDRVRFVGEAYAAIVAETVEAAKDALELVEVSWEDLPAVVHAVGALEPGAPELWPRVPANLGLDATIGDGAGTQAAFASAAHVVSFESQVQRVTGVHLEPRSAAATFDPQSGRYTVHASGGAGVVLLRDQIAGSLGVPPERVRVMAPRDVGGNFGTRNALYPDFVVLAHAARTVGRPVRQVVERQEAFLSDYQGRDLHVRAELALDANGRFTGFRSVNTSNIGAHAVSYVALNKGAQLMTSLYRVPAAHVRARAALSNTPPTIPYRSAGRPEAMYAIERMIDLAARRFGFDRVELRRRNMIPANAFPYENPFGIAYDSGDHVAAMDKALELADWNGFPARRAASRARGMCRGIGLSNYIEGTSGMPRERTEIRVLPQDRTIDLVIGTQNTGQGHETAFAQLAASWLGVSTDCVAMRAGDTDFVSAGGGSHSGRSLRFASIVIRKASDEIVARGRDVFAALCNAPVAEVIFEDGHFRLPATNRVMHLFEVAQASQDDGTLPVHLRGGLSAVADEVTSGLAFPYGAAVCEVEVDPATGVVEIVRYTSVDDVGRALNPMIVDGQTHGGIVQGVGQAMREWACYDAASGQSLSASLMDYGLSRADDFPSFTTHISEVPATSHPLGFRPGGEGGTTPSLGVTINAIVDALSEFGVEHIEMPATPLRVWEAIRAARGDTALGGT